MPGFELIGQEEKAMINEIFDRNNGVLSRYGLDFRRNNIYMVKEFEAEVKSKVQAAHCLFVNTGTAALKLGLHALGVKAGDEVITQSFTFIATVEAILELGAIPVIAEIDKSLNMDPEDMRRKITSRTKAVIPVHMGGVPAKMDEILKIASEFNLPVLEDSAQAMGAKYKGRYVGTIGNAGVFSCDIGKIITTGEGGLFVTDDPVVYQKAIEYSDHGHENNPDLPRGKDTRTIWGFNYKVTELQGAIGRAQLTKMDFILQRQKENKKILKTILYDIRGIEFRELPDPEGDAADTLIFFMDSPENALKVAAELSGMGIGTKNLPDALNWHYAGTWDHIFGSMARENGKSLKEIWSKSTEYLTRAVAIPVMVLTAEDEVRKIGETIKAVVTKIII